MSQLWILPVLVWVAGLFVPLIILVNSDDGEPIPLLPWWIYEAINVNVFGAIFLSLIGFAVSPLWWIGEFIYWLCTVGRK